jgi:N-terminal domain of anti-restriction factor ArdC
LQQQLQPENKKTRKGKTAMTEIRDVYSRITGKIIADLEQGIRPWHRPWNADHATGRITRPLRHNGIPYKGINVVMLWSAAVTKGYACPLWLTFKRAIELGGHVRKGEAGELVVYANSITRTETDARLPLVFYATVHGNVGIEPPPGTMPLDAVPPGRVGGRGLTAALAPLFPHVGQIVVADGQSLFFQGVEYKGPHGHVGIRGKFRQLFPQALA